MMKIAQFIQKSITYSSAKSCLCLGTRNNTLMAELECEYKIIVNNSAAPTVFDGLLGEKFKYYNMTTDKFFDGFGGIYYEGKVNPVDLILVDEHYSYKRSYRNIKNSLKVLSENGTIIFPKANNDDPKSELWRIVLSLRALHDDVDVITFDNPGSWAVVTKGANTNRLPFTAQEIEQMAFEDFQKNKSDFLNIKPIPHEEYLKQRYPQYNLRNHLSEIFGGYVAEALANK